MISEADELHSVSRPHSEACSAGGAADDEADAFSSTSHRTREPKHAPPRRGRRARGDGGAHAAAVTVTAHSDSAMAVASVSGDEARVRAGAAQQPRRHRGGEESGADVLDASAELDVGSASLAKTGPKRQPRKRQPPADAVFGEEAAWLSNFDARFDMALKRHEQQL